MIDLGGDTDLDAPQLDGLFDPPQLPPVVAAYRVYDWDWPCGLDGCRGTPLNTWEVTLLEVVTTRGQPLFIPAHRGLQFRPAKLMRQEVEIPPAPPAAPATPAKAPRLLPPVRVRVRVLAGDDLDGPGH